MGGCSDPKVTTMVLKVDLDCCQCFKKVKRLLCKFPQIRDQVYDKKQNTVTITVVCCSPEKIRDKLCCKGGKSIKSIEIKKPEPDKPKPKPKPQPQPEDKPKPPPAPAPAPMPVPVPVPAPAPDKPKPKPKPTSEPPPEPKPAPPSKPAEPAPKPVVPAPKPVEPAPPPKPVEPAPPKPREPEAKWVPGYPPCPPPQVFPVSACCDSCYHGLPGGPCYHGYGPGPAYAYSYGRPPCPPAYYGSRCDYFSEENPNSACSIM